MLLRGRYAMPELLRSPDGDGGGATFPAEYVKSLREEAKEHRLRATEAETRLASLAAEAQTAKAEAERVKADRDAAVAAAQADREAALAAAQTDAETRIGAARTEAQTQAQTAANERIIRAELKAEAIKAGMADLDFLKLADTSAVTIDEAGEVKIPDGFFATMKTAKPHWFGPPVTSTSSTAKAPPADNKTGDVRKLSPEEYKAARAAMAGPARIGR